MPCSPAGRSPAELHRVRQLCGGGGGGRRVHRRPGSQRLGATSTDDPSVLSPPKALTRELRDAGDEHLELLQQEVPEGTVAVGCWRVNSKICWLAGRRESPGQRRFHLESLGAVSQAVDVGAAVGSGLDQGAAGLGPSRLGQVDVGGGEALFGAGQGAGGQRPVGVDQD